MRRAFFIGAAVGGLVFIQGTLILHNQSGPFKALDLWALAWTGVFGLMLSTTPQAWVSVAIAGVALGLFYGAAALVVRAAYRSLRRVGVVVAVLLLLALHVGLYLAVIRSVVA